MSGTNIVQVNVTQNVAPIPSGLQRTGAFVSQGATDESPNTLTLLTQLSDLTPLLTGSHAITSITQVTGTATVTTTSPHGFTISDTILITIAGSTIAAYNGTFLCTITGASAFTYTVPSGTATPATGTMVYTIEDVAELLAMATTFFAQGNALSVYVLELGAGNANDGVTALTAWLTANPLTVYSLLVPRTWDGNASFLSLIASYEALTARQYFFVTTTPATWQNYTPLMKCAPALIEAYNTGIWPANVLTAATYAGGFVTATTTTAHGVLPGQYFTIVGMTPTGYNGTWLAAAGTTGSTLVYAVPTALGAESALGSLQASLYASTGVPVLEFTMASMFWATLSYNPSTTNKAAPLAFRFVFGVTPFPIKGNGALLTALKTAGINYILIGSEGGITNTSIYWGTTPDSRDWLYWYSVDWSQINIQLAIANEVINGSNNPINPLDYDQDGINRLQTRGVQTLKSAVTFGLAIGQVVQTQLDGPAFEAAIEAGNYDGQNVINAVPFLTYSAENPSHYRIGEYDGLAAAYIPARGFKHIIFNLQATDFITQ